MIAKVAASTVELKVVPPDCVTVTVPMSVPTAPTLAVPVLLSVRLEAVPPAVPATLAIVGAPDPPVPTVSVTPSARVKAAVLIAPVPPLIVASAVTLAAPMSI